ncbi:LADA_0A05380g1_1 [Lachancea dasiensis]|uniref:LADA_0A05380g1_1 n=1 Tax=Lachancea dasiensis TaxID=1072105 RepID=A0A1G4INV6_9SACH|nr:LADA_0A05380g1_1 [Lachancea dasiensis]
MYIRRAPSTNTHESGGGSCSSKSLSFLHKPQRVTQPRPFYADDSLRRNTDLNRGSIQVDQSGGISDCKVTQQAPDANPDPAEDDPAYYASLVNPYFPSETSPWDSQPKPPLVRKKSGEVVRSNLKMAQRSRSLPATPSDREPDQGLAFPLLGPKRSKSVHFDQRDVVSVKYFRQEDSPQNVASEDITEGPLDDNNDKTLSMSDDSAVRRNLTNNGAGAAEPVDLTMAMSNMRLERRASQGFGLRRSKRYQKLKANDSAAKGSGQGHDLITRPGLYRENFPTLNGGDRNSLKLNIFLNIAHNSYCFLQELCLVSDQHYLVGHILVKNIFYDKKVVVKYTQDRWRTASEVECIWTSSGDDVLPGLAMDRFKVVIDLATLYNGVTRSHGAPAVTSNPAAVALAESIADDYSSMKLEFCIQYTTRSSEERVEKWDNNNGRNYVVDVVFPKPRMGFTDPFGDS